MRLVLLRIRMLFVAVLTLLAGPSNQVFVCIFVTASGFILFALLALQCGIITLQFVEPLRVCLVPAQSDRAVVERPRNPGAAERVVCWHLGRFIFKWVGEL